MYTETEGFLYGRIRSSSEPLTAVAAEFYASLLSTRQNGICTR